jgi:hypothetical protein
MSVHAWAFISSILMQPKIPSSIYCDGTCVRVRRAVVLVATGRTTTWLIFECVNDMFVFYKTAIFCSKFLPVAQGFWKLQYQKSESTIYCTTIQSFIFNRIYIWISSHRRNDNTNSSLVFLFQYTLLYQTSAESTIVPLYPSWGYFLKSAHLNPKSHIARINLAYPFNCP